MSRWITEPRALGTFDIIFNTASGGLEPFRTHLAPGGEILTITGDLAHPVRMLGEIASSLRFGSARTRFVAAVPHRKQMDQVADSWERGAIRPVVNSVFPLADIAAAHARAEERGLLGKVVIAM